MDLVSLVPLVVATVLALLVLVLRYSSDRKRLIVEKEILSNQYRDLQCRYAVLEARKTEWERMEQEKNMAWQRSQEEMRHMFKALSSQALQENMNAFLEVVGARFAHFQESAHHSLSLKEHAFEQLVKPLHMSLKDVQASVQELEKARVNAYATLSEQVKSLAKTQDRLMGETANLAKGLRTPHVRGRWGEIQLGNVVRIAGLAEHCDFVAQVSVQGEEKRQRPDLVVHLPDHKSIIIDAKAPLQAYLEALEMEDGEQRQLKLKEHVRHLRAHISQLSAKAYWEQFSAAPEFVILFLPGEVFFTSALEHDLHLIEWAAEQDVMIATPMSLIALLKTVAYGWRQQTIAENAQKVSALGQILYDRLHVLSSHFQTLRKELSGAVDAYNKAVGSFEGRVLSAARKLKESGIASREEIAVLEPIENVPRTPLMGTDPV